MIKLYKLSFVVLFLVHFFVFTAIYGTSDNKKTVLISERIQLNTDRKVYIAGENLLFSLYLIDTKANSLAPYPSIGYVAVKSSNGNIVGKAQVRINKGLAAGAIHLSDTLKSGYYQIEAYTNFMRNASEDIFFKSQIMVANRFDNEFFALMGPVNTDTIQDYTSSFPAPSSNTLNIIPTQQNYKKREKASFKLNLGDKDIKYANLTISIVENNPVESENSKLTKFASVTRASILELEENKNKPIFLAEDKCAELQGRLFDLNTGEPVGYHVLYLTTPDTFTNFEYAVTNPQGHFKFPLPEYYSGKDLFIKVKQNDGESLEAGIVIESKFNAKGTFSPQYMSIDSSFIKYLKRSQDIVRIQKSFMLIQSQQKAKPYTGGVPRLYSVADFTVFPVDYVELKDFQEISREILPTLKIRNHESGYSAEVLDLLQSKYMSNKLMIFLDGVLIDDISQVMAYGTKDIRKIEVISTKWNVDHQEIEGIVSVFTHQAYGKSVTLNANSIKTRAESFYEMPTLNMPVYTSSGSKSREPDFRQLLYWTPYINLSSGKAETVEFYTSDYSSSYIIKVEGITNTGERIAAYSTFDVNE